MRDTFLGIDHAVVAVRDLDKASATYERLGFTLTPKSRHEALGSENRCIIMHGDYIELLSPGDHPATQYFADFVKEREGMAALAARSNDIGRSRAALIREGFKVSEPLSFSRPALMPDGVTETARFTVALIDHEQTPGGVVFGCQHHTPDFIWTQGYEKHANSAERISAVLFAAVDAPASGRRFEKIFDSVGRGGPHRSLEIQTGDAPIFVLPAENLPARFPGASDGLTAPCFAGLSIQVYDLKQTADWLTKNEIPFAGTTALHLLVAPTHANGLLLEFYKN